MEELRILILSEKKEFFLIDFLKTKGSVSCLNVKIKVEDVLNFDWIVSYGYRHIIPKEILNTVKNPIINLHISYLPFNRGSHPNYWSFKEKTKKGVTIHFIDQGIDTGPILIQKEVEFNLNDTLNSSYLKLKQEIEILFKENFNEIISGNLKPKPQIGKGTFHTKSQLPKFLDWDININNIK